MPTTTNPVSVRKYPYEISDNMIKIDQSCLDALCSESAWQNTTMRDVAKEYMRRSAEERGEAEAVQLDPTEPVQLLVNMTRFPSDHVHAELAKLHALGLDVRPFKKPAAVAEE